MKKIVVILLMFTAFSAQAQTYDWEIEPGLNTSWTVYNDFIRIAVWSDNQSAFCSQQFYIVQLGGGGMELSLGAAKPGDDTVAYMMYRPGYQNCSTLYPGMVGEAVIYQFPAWFHPDAAFRIFCEPPYSKQISFDIPQEPRLAMPELPGSVPDNATCASFRTKGFFGFRTRNALQFCAWTGSYGDMKAIYFNALVTDGSIALDPQEIILFQGEKSVNSLSYWADNSTGAALYCPDCNREVQAGGGITAAVYELPLWWDWSQPFTIRFQDQDITVSGDSPCAAASLLGGDNAGLAALRGFRDRHLAESAAGRKLIALYYRSSPRLIALLDQYPLLREAVRSGLTRFAAAFQ
ncbi:MAG: hypothetical protein JW832_14875 [Deltaproteobacteria bacterium]|nr:hypothetical protein [Deltaproteobacteria bacterium]